MGTHPIFESDFDCLTDMAQVKENLNIIINNNITAARVELFRQEFDPYVVIELKSKKPHNYGVLDLDQTKAVLDAEDSSRFSVETDSKNPEKSKKIEFVARNDHLAQYWTDVFNKKLHFEHKRAGSNMPTLEEEEVDDDFEPDEDTFQSLIDNLRHETLTRKVNGSTFIIRSNYFQPSREEVEELDD